MNLIGGIKASPVPEDDEELDWVWAGVRHSSLAILVVPNPNRGPSVEVAGLEPASFGDLILNVQPFCSRGSP